MWPKYINEDSLNQFINSALAEDIGDGDHSSLASIPAKAKNSAYLLMKDSGIIAGIDFAKVIFKKLDPNIEIEALVEDGEPVLRGDIIMKIHGNSRAILAGERLMLNCMQRMSGIATYTNKLAKVISHTKTKLLDTRKTTPNFRLMEKWAVHIGGGVNHRFGLFDMIMLKDNHNDFAGGITQAVSATKDYLATTGRDLKIEVETRNLDEVKEVLSLSGVHRIMLDNMSPKLMKEALGLIQGRLETEASGGISETTIQAVAETGVDYISVGAMTHSAKSLDISLKAEN
jgi:nicotinate-nucleotide pyrophosphorylase (carboxylating)